MNQTLTIIPTFNEVSNIGRLIDHIIKLRVGIDVLVIDDGSPDGTAEIVREKMSIYPDRVFMIEREGKLGLGTAYVEGFKFALGKEYLYICEMDADFSHSPTDLPRLIHAVSSGKTDIAIGSRYSKGISIVNWPKPTHSILLC